MHKPKRDENLKPLLVDIDEARRQLGGRSRTTIYALIASGRLEATRIGRRTLIRMESIERVAREGA